MRQLEVDLWQTEPEHPFGEHMSTHAYLVVRPKLVPRVSSRSSQRRAENRRAL
jgi:hypothetical protein